MSQLSENISDIHERFSNDTIWLGGDFNLPDIDWRTGEVVGSQYPAVINESLMECTSHSGLEQLVLEPTRGNATLDLFFTNRPSLVDRCTIAPGIGDHDIIHVTSTVTAKRRKPPKRKVFLWKRADKDKLHQLVEEFQGKFLAKYNISSNIESMWQDIKSSLLNIVRTTVPSKDTTTRFNQVWVNGDVKRKARQKKRSHQQARETRSEQDLRRYRKIKKECKIICKEAYNSYINNMISLEGSNKKFWAYVKNLRKDSSGVAPLKDNTGLVQAEPKRKADILNNQFSSVFNKEEDLVNIPDKGPSPYRPMPPIKITRNGLLKLLQGLKIHKATGPDEISCRLLKEVAEQICPVYMTFFQASINQGVIPIEWKTANVIPIFKKGDKQKAENYRPVSLTSVSCKLLEHIMCSNILKHLDKFNILTDAQHGFRKARSCESQLITTIEDLAKSIDDTTQTDVILLDFAKAFDKVPHGRLLYKLEFYGIRHHHHKWIADFLNNRTQQVHLDNVASDSAPVQSGVPQGSVLGPLLFLLFINDLPEKVSKGTQVRLFADDCALYRKIQNDQDCQILQKDLDSLQEWEKDWMMSFHPSKCQVLNVTTKKNKISHPYTIHGHQLAVEKTVKYLGVNINEKLSWNDHISQTVKKANNTISFLQRNTSNCPRETKALCYTTLVRPLVEYSSVVWDPHTQTNIDSLEMIQRRAARYVFNDYRRTSSVNQMLVRLKWISLEERRAKAKAIMMYRALYNLVALQAPARSATSNITRGNCIKLHVPYTRTAVYLKSFYPDTIRIWNNLDLRTEIKTLDQFKNFIYKTAIN